MDRQEPWQPNAEQADSWPDSRNLSASWQRERTPGGNASSPPDPHLLSLSFPFFLFIYLSHPPPTSSSWLITRTLITNEWALSPRPRGRTVMILYCPLLEYGVHYMWATWPRYLCWFSHTNPTLQRDTHQLTNFSERKHFCRPGNYIMSLVALWKLSIDGVTLSIST